MTSTFLDRLERELVEAMERHERRWRFSRWLPSLRVRAIPLVAAVAAVALAVLVLPRPATEVEREAVPSAPPAPSGVAGSWRKPNRLGGDDLRGSVKYEGGQQLALTNDRWRVYDPHQEAPAQYMAGLLRWREDGMLLAPSGACAQGAAYRVTRQGANLRIRALRDPCGQRRTSLTGSWRGIGG